MAQEHHPDKNPSPQAKDKFAEINKYPLLYSVPTRSSRIAAKEIPMIKPDQQTKILMLGFRIRIFSASFEVGVLVGRAEMPI